MQAAEGLFTKGGAVLIRNSSLILPGKPLFDGMAMEPRLSKSDFYIYLPVFIYRCSQDPQKTEMETLGSLLIHI